MSYSYVERTGDGVATTFNFAFTGKGKGYLLANQVNVYTWNGTAWVSASGWSLSGTNQITFLTPPANGTRILIRRIAAKDYPFAQFEPGVMLDMASLNNTFIHLLEITQELLDGFYPDGFYLKQNLNMGGWRITNLGDGVDPKDAVNKGQLDAVQDFAESVDQKHTIWNDRQDQQIDGLLKAFDSNISHRTAPWTYEAAGGETMVFPPFYFASALVWRDGAYQDQLSGAFEIDNNVITLADPPLRAGERVSVLVGSYITPADPGSWEWIHVAADGSTTSVDLGVSVSAIDDVTLDGLSQGRSNYTLTGTVLDFGEVIPECTVGARVQLA